jgi:hypothetical protein
MTDITLRRGDSQNYRVTVTDGTNPIDLTDAVVKFAVKKRIQDTNAEAIIFKASYDAREIEITNAAGGEFLIYIKTEDTFDKPPATYSWDVEVTRRGSLKTNVGTVAVTQGSGLLAGTGLEIGNFAVGDILVPTNGVSAENQVDVTIQEVEGDSGTGNATTDYTGFVTQTGITFELYEGDRKTPVGLSGRFTISADAVR